jgi:hypothetical protein
MSAIKLLEKIVKKGWENSGLMIDTTWNIPIELKWEADAILKRRKKALKQVRKERN